MRVLIAYASVEGQTGKIAQAVQEQVRAAGHTAEIYDTSDLTGQVDLTGIDKVICAAPVHERKHPQSFEVFLTAQREALASLSVMLLSVSLNAAFADGQDEAQDYLTELKMRTGLAPQAELLVAGAVRDASYDYFQTQVLRHVVLRDKPYDPAEGPQEFTDWAALTEAVAAFLQA